MSTAAGNSASDAEGWTVQRILEWTTDFLKRKGIESPRLESELLLAHARRCQRIRLYTDFNLLLTDSESMVPVRRATDNVVAFAEGRSDGSLRLRLVNLGVNPIKKGDVFVTSGAGGLFRPGIAVALATEITRDGAIAQLLSNPAATDVVLVEPVWQRKAIEAADALEEKTARED